jgi:hypothetical protein
MVRAAVLLLSLLLIGGAVGFPALNGDGVRFAAAEDWPAKFGKKKKDSEGTRRKKDSGDTEGGGGGGGACKSFAKANKCMARKSVRFRSCECIGQ